MFQNINRDSLPFLRAARIERGSEEHKQLKTTVQALHRKYLHPFKYLEEQAEGSVDQLIGKARISLPWLDKYEDGWPARIYLKRYVDTRRPHLKCTKYARWKKMRVQKGEAFLNVPGNLDDSSDMTRGQDSIIREFLGSLSPNLEHHLDAFVKLGIKDQETLRAFLSWPEIIQAHFLDEGHRVLQLTSLEKRGLFVGCSLLTQKALQGSLTEMVKLGNLHP